MDNLLEKTVGSIVAEDYRTATIFKKHEIDFCCNGKVTITEACNKKNIDSKQVVDDIEKLLTQTEKDKNTTTDYQSWPLDLLADHIENRHHRFVNEQTPILKSFLDKLCSVHGGRHPELFEIRSLFNDSAEDLGMHMKKEELMLFPFIRKMVAADNVRGNKPDSPFGTVQNPVQMMMHEHDAEGERFRQIKQLSSDYTPPEDACNTYKVTYSLLQAFEEDLYLHIHLENNILFPKAIEVEQHLTVINNN
jgi:regulator of cell morphogenesis and NO signaling